MENAARFLFFSFSTFILVTAPAQSAYSCEPDSCASGFGPIVRFPFRLSNRQPARCGYPGFDLHCDSRNQTILNLPRSGQFVVDHINYAAQALFISDPGSCLSNRSLNFSLVGSPFQANYFTMFAFLNCSGGWTEYPLSDDYVTLLCLSGTNNTVLASSPRAQPPPRCRRIADVRIPPLWTLRQRDSRSMTVEEAFELGWSEPECGRCENRGGICGFKGDSGLEIGCSKTKSSGLSRGAKYAIIVGVGIPGLLCLIGLTCYICSKLKTLRHRRQTSPHLPIVTVFDQRSSIRVAGGLDLPTIESYPKTVLGQSGRLPKPSDNTCSICLSEYQPEETLRSIPECCHYFHAGCIDEWLKLNGTCPVCRNSPEGSSTLTSCFSMPSTESSETLDRH